jgi:hydroxymethylpyrimidine pyrophosphatase-like HAD family hydrolase
MGVLVREAITAARARGITVVLVTGRILDELKRVAGDLTFVDGVVAENGAVLHFPETGHTTTIAAPAGAGLRHTRGHHPRGACPVQAVSA